MDAVREGTIEVTATVDKFDGRGQVVLADGPRLDAHAVVLATGYRRDIESLVGHLSVLDANSKPVVQGHRSAAPGLRFLGYDARSSLIGHMANQSKRMAKRIATELG